MKSWAVIVSGAIPLVFVDDVELDTRNDVFEVIELGHGDRDGRTHKVPIRSPNDFDSSKRVELRGIEPLTYSMRTSRATNCAIAP